MEGLTIFQREGSVSCDFEGLRTKLEAYISLYENKEFTEETKTEAKKDVADIRKSRKEFEQAMKEAKEKYMIPWNAFADRCNELLDLYDKPIIRINEQIEKFENKRKEEKEQKIKEIFGEMVFEDEILAYLPLSKVYNTKWLNSTYNEKQIKDDIMAAKLNVKQALDTIKAMDSDVEGKALEVFKETLSLPEAIKAITDYEANKKVFKQKVAEETRADVIDTFMPVDDGSETKDFHYTIFLTNDGKNKLESLMDSMGIEYVCRED